MVWRKMGHVAPNLNFMACGDPRHARDVRGCPAEGPETARRDAQSVNLAPVMPSIFFTGGECPAVLRPAGPVDHPQPRPQEANGSSSISCSITSSVEEGQQSLPLMR